MGVLKIDLSSSQRMRWPNKCPYCGEKADTEARTSLTVFAGELRYFVVAFGWTERKYTISYPVCRKHNKFVYTRMPSWGFWGNLFVFLMITLALPALVVALQYITSDVLKYLAAALAVAIYVFSFFCLFISPFILKPVRISPSGKGSAKLYIRNEGCFREYRILNQNILLP